MEFGPVPLEQAEGAILAHSVKAEGLRLRKGVTLDAERIEALRGAGVGMVTVARLGAQDVHEDAAATRLAQAVLGRPAGHHAGQTQGRAAGGGTGLRASPASTGRVNLYAEARGVVLIDRAAVDAVNRVDPAITIATVPEWQHIGEGGMVATIKIIAYGVAGDALARAEAAISGAIRLAPTVLRRAALIQSTTGGDDGAKGQRATRARLQHLGLDLAEPILVAHDEAAIAAALGGIGATGASGDVDLVLVLTASATSDIDDVAPAAVRRAGGTVEHFGMPVDPGNLLFVGRLAGRPVIGLPGCARSPALNGADWVLQRLVCGVPVGGDEIMGMGVGGLLKEIPTRPRPREG